MAEQEKMRQADLRRDLDISGTWSQSLGTSLDILSKIKVDEQSEEDRQLELRKDLKLALKYGMSIKSIQKLLPFLSHLSSSNVELQVDLINAIKSEQSIETIKSICAKLESVNFNNKEIPLHLVCYDYYNPDIIQLLVEFGADVNILDQSQISPILKLAKIGALGMVKYLLEKGANPKQLSVGGNDILAFARRSNVPEMISFAENLLKGEDEKSVQERLISAIKEKNSLESIKEICYKLNNINFGNSIHNNPLLMVSTYGTYREELVKLFIDRGADVNTKEESTGTTPILYMTSAGRVEMVKYLIGKGADHTIKNKYGNTMISASKGSQSQDMIAFVESLFSKLKKSESELQKELVNILFEKEYYTKLQQVRNICQEFKSNGFSLNFGKDHYSSPILITCSMKFERELYKDILTALVEYGANVNYESYQNCTPILFAAQSANLEAIKFLIEKGANPRHIPNYYQESNIVYFAEQSRCKKTLEFVKNIIKEPQESQESLRLKLIDEINTKYNFDTIKELCSKLETLNFGTDHTNCPLFKACTLDYMGAPIGDNLIRLFVEYGVDINYKSAHGTTAIMYLAQSGNLKMLDYLITKGADHTIKTVSPNMNVVYSLEYFAKCSGSSEIMAYVNKLVKGKDEAEESDTSLRQKLLTAIKDNQDLEVIKKLTDKLSTLNFGKCLLTNPLLMVCSEDYYNPDLIMLFVEKGADVNFNSYFKTPLMFLADIGALDMMKYLVSKGANPFLRNDNYDLQYYAIRSRSNDIIKYVKELFSKPSENMSQDDFQRMLIQAIDENDDFDKIKELCKYIKNFNFGKNRRDSPLLKVCDEFNYNPDLIKLFVELGADVNYKSTNGVTSIMYLALFGALDMVKFLIEKGANPTLLDNYNYDLVYYSELSNVKEMIDYSYEVVGKQNKKLQKDLLVAIKNYADISDIKKLCEAIGNLNYGDNHETSPLLSVCVQDTFNPDLIKLFLDLGADINYKSLIGSTPIMFLAEFGALEMVKYLVSRGADYTIKNKYGYTVERYAKYSKVPEMIEYASDLVNNKHEEPVVKQIVVEHVVIEPLVVEPSTVEQINIEKPIVNTVESQEIMIDTPKVAEIKTVIPTLPASSGLEIEENFVKPFVSNMADSDIKENFIN